MKTKLTTRAIAHKKKKNGAKTLSMLTCYDFQTAQLLNETELDLILVGDSLGNVVLGYETTVPVKLQDMITFGSAVKRGAKNTFTVIDLPFGSYASLEKGLSNAIELFQRTEAEALKLEGAGPSQLELIERLGQNGVAIMGHIGLLPQSVHQQGGYYKHGKDELSAERLIKEAKDIEKAGAFALVLECVQSEVSQKITEELNIPTIGIGSGAEVDGQVLVINDLLGMGQKEAPSFCSPKAQLYQFKKEVIESYLKEL